VGSFYLGVGVLWAVLIAAGFVVLRGRVFPLIAAVRAAVDRLLNRELGSRIPPRFSGALSGSALPTAWPASSSLSAIRSTLMAR
jgi:hypothetical protein